MSGSVRVFNISLRDELAILKLKGILNLSEYKWY